MHSLLPNERLRILNNIAPLSKNQKLYLQRAKNSWFNVAEGGKRGGKNVLNTLAYCLTLETHPDRLHLIAGVSQSTAGINILDCDGYGLLNYFEGRCREGKFKDKNCVYVSTVKGEKIILVAGGGKNGDERYIKGNTYGTAYITEANECSESFIKEVFDRTLSSNDRKIFHDLNPKPPTHWYYSKILDFHEQAQIRDKNYGYNYGHFTIADNFSITNEKLKKVLTTYEKGTVWYDRDIRGLRRAAEGIVFQDFAEHTDNYIAGAAPRSFKWVGLGFDIGGNGSAYAITCSALGVDNIIYVLRSQKKQAPDLPMSEVDKFVFDFIRGVEIDYGVRINSVNCDHSDVIINTLNEKRYIFAKTYKPPLEDRPFLFSLLMARGRFKIINGECEALVSELQNLIYDSKKEKPIVLDDGSMQIDAWDSLTYSVSGNWHYLSEGVIL